MGTVIDRFVESVEFRRYSGDKPMPLDLVHLGLIGETGEVCDIIKKAEWHGKDLDRDHLIEELGDVAWYAAAAWLAEGPDEPFSPFREPLPTALVPDSKDLAMVVNEAVVGTGGLRNVLSYIGDVAANVDATLDDVLEANMAKLARRYPLGFVEGGGIR